MDYPLHRPPNFEQKAEVFGWDNPIVRRALSRQIGAEVVTAQKAVADSTSGASLIVQGVEPKLYANFVQKFPLYDMIEKVEANGLVHAYDRYTAYSQLTQDQPVTMSENATVSDDSNTYSQATTNIAIFGTRRGASLKSMFAVRQGLGAFGDLSERELQGGLMKIAHDVQAETVRMQNTDATATTATDEDGLYDANGFNGLRYTLQNVSPGGNTINLDISGGFTASAQALSGAIRAAANVVENLGGNPDMIIGTIGGREYLVQEAMNLVRYVNQREIIPGVTVPSVVAGNSELPFITLPGTSVGTYTTGGTTSFFDVYVVDSSTISMPWLGGPTPTVLDIQIGADGTLRKLYIPFLMVGLAFHTPSYLARVKVKTAA